MRTGIYAIYDTKAQLYVGGLQLHRHDAAAVRVFDDLARDNQTLIGRHPADFNLLLLGHLEDDNCMTSNAEDLNDHEHPVIMNGTQWAAINQPKQPVLDEPPIGEPHTQPTPTTPRQTASVRSR